jgi:hypothetical protein
MGWKGVCVVDYEYGLMIHMSNVLMLVTIIRSLSCCSSPRKMGWCH